MPVPNVLLANECGMGRGHIANLAHVIKHMGKEFCYFAGLHNLEHADALKEFDVHVFKSVRMHLSAQAMENRSLEGHATWGDYMFSLGLARENLLRENLKFWIKQIIDKNISVLVAEYAPIAMLAAHVINANKGDVFVIAVGTAYSVPPAHLPQYPVLLPDFTHSVHSEADVLALINRVIAEYNAPPLPSIPALYAVDLALPMAFAQFDPYRNWRAAGDLVLPHQFTAPPREIIGDEVFIYISYAVDEPAIWDALCDLPLPRRAFLPVASDAVKQRLRMAGVIVEDGPVPLDLLSARSRIMVNLAQSGTVQMAAKLGLPQIGLPMHLEHSFNGRRAGQKGVMELLEPPMRSKQNIINIILRSYHSAEMQACARNFAAELAQESHDTSRSMVSKLAPILARYAAG